MAPGGTGRDGSRRKRRGQPDCNSSWNARLKEIAAMLPISVPPNGRGLTKKETLVHMLQYLDFLESHIQTLQERLPPHCLPQPCGRGWGGVESNENTQSEPELESETPPCSLKTNRKHGCRRAPLSTEAWEEGQGNCWKLYRNEPSVSDFLIEDQSESLPMWSGRCDWLEPQPAISQGVWPLQDSDSLPSSLDSAFSPSQLFTLSAPPGEAYGEQEWRCPGEGGRCSDCEGQTGSENSSPSSRGAQDSPLIGSWALMLRDRMLDSPVPMGSPPRCNSLLPLLSTSSTAPSLNLSPSLLTSPARGLSHYLLPQGQELQALFEDVWVTPKSITPKLSSVPRTGQPLKATLSCRPSRRQPRAHPHTSHTLPVSLEDDKVSIQLVCAGATRSGHYSAIARLGQSLPPQSDLQPQPAKAESGLEWEVDMGTGGGCVSSQSEGEDCTWTPNQRATPRRRGHGGRRRWVTRRKRQRSRPSLKKKCVNGFIMFCRINRKIYLRLSCEWSVRVGSELLSLGRSHPGTPSTVVTKELAHLWHIMPKQERCVYWSVTTPVPGAPASHLSHTLSHLTCSQPTPAGVLGHSVKARRFSRQQNRNVRSVEEEGEEGVASPLHMLLAHRDLYASASRERY
ncbi:hypothetical protein JZ751_024190 [Albula glossodonta]|uniref:BHLH domain-containing protein n=1 Tax=Albula glossodonta TaxID=121402 RepID=A0A8T2MXX1_9TELE|nr:hypothetical protein JZ751_024190 [Albula glossodonta]